MTEHIFQPHEHTCICACKNPVVNLLKDKIFGPENLDRMKATLPKDMAAAPLPEPMLVTGGILRPMIDGKTERVEAVGFAEGKVVATGTMKHVAALMDEYYQGKYSERHLEPHQTLLPGLFEPHIHVVFSGIMASWVNVGPFNGQDIREGYTADWVLQTLTGALPQGVDEIVLANGLDPALLTPNAYNNFLLINYQFLDKVSLTVPVMVISASGHTVYMNSAALVSVYKANTAKLQAQYGCEKEFVKQTNGLLQEEAGLLLAFGTFQNEIADKTAHITENINAFITEANSRGVTSMYDALLNEEYLKYLIPYLDSVKLRRIRLGGARYCEAPADVSSLTQYTAPASYSDLYYGHVKVVSDGSNQGLTGYQSTGYACEPQNSGLFDFTKENYQNLIDGVIIEKGWPLMIHANGDEAVTMTINAYRKALERYNGPALRNRIEHCSLLRIDEEQGIDQIREMAELGISPSFLIGHVGYWGYPFKKIIFQDQKVGKQLKTDMLDLCKSALKENLRITLHSDHTVTPTGPLRMMEQSITRVMESRPPGSQEKVLNAAECLTPEEALRAATYDAAWQCYADQWAGSLANGYFADFIILEKDPLSMPADQISMNMRNIKVEETWLGGVLVYPPILPK
ncbi:amidohydrolase [Mucilaginibacter sp. Bleaf8]|uniref:amidohydrolase n=1 Tax=Mucilaginibacter sp. Bleaf8 TaxID=2834430 RepID=UPI001BD0900E|nr:amidohydrolase [Mucilaginibacter sp. Bleaf8]MBS7563039.1 amidohydrolase [Mucilaginibacter sp. Bleaf8]